MANIVQMGISAFWEQLQKLSRLAHALQADLEADKQALTQAYSATRRDPDSQRAAKNRAALDPLIHNNSTLRLRYRGLVGKFNAAVNAAAAQLRAAGFTAPNLSGDCCELAVAPIVIGGVAVAALAAAFLVYQSVRTATDSQRRATAAMVRCINDPTLSDAERAQCRAALAEVSTTPVTGVFSGLGQLVPILGLAAAIYLGPQLLRAFGPKRAAA